MAFDVPKAPASKDKRSALESPAPAGAPSSVPAPRGPLQLASVDGAAPVPAPDAGERVGAETSSPESSESGLPTEPPPPAPGGRPKLTRIK